jgi:membrane-bound lytic murein transglycosylase D
MRLLCILVLVLAAGFRAEAQNDNVSLDDLLSAGEQWARDNLDDNVLRALQDVDQAKVRQLFTDLQARFQGEYVVDLAPLKQTASTLLPLLEGFAETRPYAMWLKTRLDYLAVADEFRLTIPPPTVEPGQPPKPVPNPSPELERKVWKKQLDQRPLPTGANAYAARLKPIFVAQGVPGELVWLAEVESSFDPTARSPVGAAGMFQLMPPTARQLGLALRPSDERLQPEKSARAAARYLSYLHGQFHDWPLALAAYNAGEGNVQRLLDKYKAKSFDRIAVHLPAETQMYVPKIDATLQRREGITLAQLKALR